MGGLYGEDLAHVHDAGFQDLAEAAARMVVELLPAPGDVADLGCGSGVLLEGLARHGHRLWGCDASPAMVALARTRLPGVPIVVADAATVSLGPSDAICAVGEVLSYAMADAGDVQQALGSWAGRMARALRPGGVLLLDCAGPGRCDGAVNAARQGRGWRVEASAVRDGDVLTRTIDTWRTMAGRERHAREVHRLRLLDAEDVLAALASAGLEAQSLGGYDDFGFQEGWDGYLARRPGGAGRADLKALK